MRLIARCVHGLEWVVADEIATASGGDVRLARREVTVEAREPFEAWFTTLSTVDDVFAEAGRFGGVGTVKAALPDLGRGIERLPWGPVIDAVRRVRQLPAEPLIDVVASLEGRRSYNRFAVERTAGETLSRVLGGTYLPRTTAGRAPGEPDLTVRLFLRGDLLIAAVRLLAEPLHRRSYKLDTGPGTLHPPVAAALARLAAPRPDAVVLDPFGGDGTIAIETGLACPQTRIVVRDTDPVRVANTIANAARAGVALDVAGGDAGALDLAGVSAVDAIVTNPPWNLAVDAGGVLAGSLESFWRCVPDLLAPGGRLVVLADDALGLPDQLGEQGFAIGLASAARVAGRVCHMVIAAPPGAAPPPLPDGVRRWRQRAVHDGVVSDDGF